jgi:hypothetical protein
VRTLLVVLGVIALLLLLGGAVNSDTEVSFDYVAGSTAAASLFWVALVVAAGLVVAGIAGWTVARTGDANALRKLEKELEATYRRLRDCEARLPRAAEPSLRDTATLVAPAPAEAATIAAPVPTEGDTVVARAPAEEGTVATTAPAEEATVVTDGSVDDATVARDAPDAESSASGDPSSS